MAAQLCQSDKSETIVMQSKRIYGLEPDGFNGAQSDSKPQRCTAQEFTTYKNFDSLTCCLCYFVVLFLIQCNRYSSHSHFAHHAIGSHFIGGLRFQQCTSTSLLYIFTYLPFVFGRRIADGTWCTCLKTFLHRATSCLKCKGCSSTL